MHVMMILALITVLQVQYKPIEGTMMVRTLMTAAHEYLSAHLWWFH